MLDVGLNIKPHTSHCVDYMKQSNSVSRQQYEEPSDDLQPWTQSHCVTVTSALIGAFSLSKCHLVSSALLQRNLISGEEGTSHPEP